MVENLYWTEKIKFGEIRDPLQLAVFKFPEVYFLTGITTQTQRLRYYTFVTWAWNQIQEKNSAHEKMRDMEKILTLVSARHHLLGENQPTGIENITFAKNFLFELIREKFEDSESDIDFAQGFDIDKFREKKFVARGNNYYRAPLKDLYVWDVDKDDDIIVSPAGKDISTIFSEHIGKTADKIWSKTVHLDELSNSLCCCSISPKEQNFWKHVFFGLTTMNKDGGIEIDPVKQLKITDPDKLSFEKFTKLDETIEMSEDEEDVYSLDDSFFDYEDYKTTTVMRQGTLFMLLEIIKNSRPRGGRILNQTIRD